MMNKIRIAKNGRLTEEITIKDSSYEGLQESGWDAGDNNQAEREIYARINKKTILNYLTGAQRRVALLLLEGDDRKEIARKMMVSEQAVNQIIPRMKRRLTKLGLSYDSKNYRRRGSQKPRVSIPLP
jgi:DNA-binding NarL/FixJ family response regulator